MLRTRVLGTGLALPDRVVTNDELSRMMDTTDEWIRTRTGIQERRWVREGETGTEMGHRASSQALEMAGVAPGEIDAIVYATSSPDHFAPGNGVFLQRMLGVGTIPAIDIRTQCSGFVYALSVADGWIRTGQYKRVLVVGSEIQSTGLEQNTDGRNTAVIFADGAGAVVVGPTDEENRGILAFDLHSEGAHAEKLWVDAPGSMYHPRVSKEQVDEGRQYLVMDGKEVFRHAVVRMPESVRAVLAATGHTIDDVKLLVAAPGQPPHRRDDAAGALPAGRSGVQQHHVLRQHHRGDDPDRAGRMRARGPHRAGGSGRADGVRVGVPVGERRGEVVGRTE